MDKPVSKNIYLHLQGGLGNQLFQYFAAFSLCQKNHYNLNLLTDFYNLTPPKTTPRQLQLDLVIPRSKLHYTKTYPYPQTHPNRIQSFFKKQGQVIGSYSVFEETSSRYQKWISRVPTNALLRGYFQSEKYFYKDKESIRALVFPQKTFSRRYYDFKKQINSEKLAVSLHVRRGDYVHHAGASQTYESCSPEYYKKATESFIRATNKNAKFFIFSDDVKWAETNLNFIDNAFICKTDPLIENQDVEDLFLMTNCSHHIIANSSFSWWGAWLNPNPNKMVISPKHWFKSNHLKTQDLIPKKWIQI